MKIAICDDVLECAKDLEDKVVRILRDKKIEYNIDVYTSGRDLINTIIPYDLIFLDIDMPEMDGIRIGKELCKNKSLAKIIMVTSIKERFKEAFTIQAFRFVTKPVEDFELVEAVSAAIDAQIGIRGIELYENRFVYCITQKEISYIRAFNGQIEVFVGNRILRKKKTLGGILGELDQRLFVQINRQYIINMSKIEKVNGQELICAGKPFKISRRAAKQFYHSYLEYDLKYRG